MKLERRSAFGWPATTAGYAPCTNGLVIHYDGASAPRNFGSKSHLACRDYWKWCRTFHMGGTRRWQDIGYSYACCPHGIVMEGRGFQHVQAAQPGGNSTWTSVTLMLGEGEYPTDAQVEAVRELRTWLRGQGLAAAVRGHQDFISTSCPGAKLYALVKNGTFQTSPATAILPTLREGMTGPHVKTAQTLLTKHGYALAADGEFGPKTAKAAKAFKTAKKLDQNSTIGPAAWAELKKTPKK